MTLKESPADSESGWHIELDSDSSTSPAVVYQHESGWDAQRPNHVIQEVAHWM